jgi:hypothetical protein
MSNDLKPIEGSDWLNDIRDNFKELNGGVGNAYFAIQATEAFYDKFMESHDVTYLDGSKAVHNTIQAAIDATLANRGDAVYVIGEWAITVPILLNKWGTALIGSTLWNNLMGGGNSNITCTGEAVSVVNVTKAKTLIENLVLYMNGIGTTKGIEYSGSAPSQSVLRNLAIIKNGGDDAEGQGIKFTTVPTRSCFSDLFISGNTSGAKRLNQGILGASYSCVFKRIVIGRTAYQAIYNVGTSNDLYDDVTILPSCSVGMEIGGVDAASSLIKHCHNLAATPGTSTAIISQSYIAGLSAYTG